MSKSIKLRGLLVLVLLVLALVSLAPTFFAKSLPDWWTNTFDPVHLGLDLQGGMHLVLGVEVDRAVESRVDSFADQMETFLRERDIVFRSVSRVAGDRLAVTVYDQQSAAQLDAMVREVFPNLEPATVQTQAAFVERHYRITEREVAQIRDWAVRQALETLRNRVDEFGVSEPTLQRQGDDRILIQLPGISDPERAIALIGRTARLEFKFVAEDASPQAALRGDIPAGTELLHERRVDTRTGIVTETPIVVHQATIMTGDLLSDARIGIDTRFNEPYVSMEFSPVGARRFDQITAANVGRRLAIVLDDTVYSAPVIRERISGGRAQISGSFTEQEATDLAIVLRAGALPAPVNILEDRTVGPSLGRDSIRQGVVSAIFGGILVVAAMWLYYRWAGVLATLALAFNIVFILAILSLFGATLTLPGIAGIVLTMGMAIDANVLIFERIREELRLGKTVRSAIEAGYAKALSSIVDANVTTLIAALVLFQFGTGPVKGFAVTLSVGIVSSMFTAIFATRVVFDYFLERRHPKRLSI